MITYFCEVKTLKHSLFLCVQLVLLQNFYCVIRTFMLNAVCITVADLGFLKGGFQCNITIVATEWHAKHA